MPMSKHRLFHNAPLLKMASSLVIQMSMRHAEMKSCCLQLVSATESDMAISLYNTMKVRTCIDCISCIPLNRRKQGTWVRVFEELLKALLSGFLPMFTHYFTRLTQIHLIVQRLFWGPSLK